MTPIDRWHRAIAAALRWAIDESQTPDEVRDAGRRNAAAVAVLKAEAPALRAEVHAYAAAKIGRLQ